MVRALNIKTNKEKFGHACITKNKIFNPDEKEKHKRVFELSSTSGNKYYITLDGFLRCTCHEFFNSNKRCKHINFIMKNVLYS